jgi:hypothetical protein
LKPLLGWHGARLNFLALFLIALLRVKTINLVELATGFRTKTKTDSNYKGLQRLSKLLALMSLAMCWAMKMGQWLHSHSPLKINKHGRLSKSVFRYGLDYLRSIVTDLDLKHRDFLDALEFLSCT